MYLYFGEDRNRVANYQLFFRHPESNVKFNTTTNNNKIVMVIKANIYNIDKT